MSTARHAAVRRSGAAHGRYSRRRGSRRRRSKRTWFRGVVPALGFALLAGAGANAVADGDTPLAATADAADTTTARELLEAREQAIDRPGRADARIPMTTPTPAPTPTETPTPTPAPTPTPTGFAPVPGCTATVPDEGEVSNGQLGDAHLCGIGDGHQLRPDAAAAFLALDDAYTEEFGTGICVGDSYRNLSEQYAVKAQKPYLAAKPGTSNHGWGLALDLDCGADTFGGQAYQWLDENGSDFGWHNPPWARAGGSKPEAWHWEFDPSLLG